MPQNNMVRAISDNGGIVICVVNSTNIVQKMEEYHKTSAVMSAALGRLLTGASLMGSWLKDEGDSLTLRVNGGGAAGTLVAVTDGSGNPRGYAEHPFIEYPLREDGHLDVGGVVGHDGTLSVIRDLGLKEPYIGQVPLVSGEIAQDITSYYATSEQTPCVCALGVIVDKDLSIKKAGGYLLQLLPGATNEEITMLEENIKKITSVSGMLEEGRSIYDIMHIVMEGFDPDILYETHVEYKCYCSRPRSENILLSLGRAELAKIQKEDPIAHVECHFCNKKYDIDIAELLQRLDAEEAAANP